MSRWVVSRVVGSLGVAGASLIDTIKELALGLLTGAYAFGTGLGSIALKGKTVNPLKLKNATGRDALNHLRDAVIHAVTIVTAPVLGLIAPSKLLLPVMVKINLSDATKSSFLHEIANQTRRISTRQLAFIGASLLGLTAIGHSYGALSALKAVALPWAQNAVSFPLTRKIAAAVTGLLTPRGSGVLHQLGLVVDKINQLHPVAKLTGLAALLLGMGGAFRYITHRIKERREFAAKPTGVLIAYSELPIYAAELARRTISLTTLLNTLDTAVRQIPEEEAASLAMLVDNEGRKWELRQPNPEYSFLLAQHPAVKGQHMAVKDEKGIIITTNEGVVLLSPETARQLVTRLKTAPNAQLLPHNLEDKIPQLSRSSVIAPPEREAAQDRILNTFMSSLSPAEEQAPTSEPLLLATLVDANGHKWKLSQSSQTPHWAIPFVLTPPIDMPAGEIGTVFLSQQQALQLATSLNTPSNAQWLPSDLEARIKEVYAT